MDDGTPLSTAEMVDVLLKDYQVLREEISVRIGSRANFLGLAVTLVAIVASVGDTGWPVRVGLSLGGGAVILGVWWHIGVLIARLAAYIKTIEARVNELAGTVLLGWETSVPDSRSRK